MPWLAWLAGCSKADLEIVLELVDPGGTTLEGARCQEVVQGVALEAFTEFGLRDDTLDCSGFSTTFQGLHQGEVDLVATVDLAAQPAAVAADHLTLEGGEQRAVLTVEVERTEVVTVVPTVDGTLVPDALEVDLRPSGEAPCTAAIDWEPFDGGTTAFGDAPLPNCARITGTGLRTAVAPGTYDYTVRGFLGEEPCWEATGTVTTDDTGEYLTWGTPIAPVLPEVADFDDRCATKTTVHLAPWFSGDVCAGNALRVGLDQLEYRVRRDGATACVALPLLAPSEAPAESCDAMACDVLFGPVDVALTDGDYTVDLVGTVGRTRCLEGTVAFTVPFPADPTVPMFLTESADPDCLVTP